MLLPVILKLGIYISIPLHLEVLRGFLLGDRPGRVIEHETLPGIGAALAEFAVVADSDD